MEFNKYTDRNIYLLNGKKDYLYNKDLQSIKNNPTSSNPDIKTFLKNIEYIKILLELNPGLFHLIDFSNISFSNVDNDVINDIIMLAIRLDYTNIKYVKNPTAEMIEFSNSIHEDIIMKELAVSPNYILKVKNPTRQMIEFALKASPILINNINNIYLIPSDYIKAFKIDINIFTHKKSYCNDYPYKLAYNNFSIPQDIELLKALVDIHISIINHVKVNEDSPIYEEFYLYCLSKIDSMYGNTISYYSTIPVNESLLLKYLEQTVNVENILYFDLSYKSIKKLICELIIKHNFNCIIYKDRH
jgi:hypothetical protein